VLRARPRPSEREHPRQCSPLPNRELRIVRRRPSSWSVMHWRNAACCVPVTLREAQSGDRPYQRIWDKAFETRPSCARGQTVPWRQSER
jgi:hypothetical protein